AVQCLEGKAAWDAAAAGRWDRGLLDAAIAAMPERKRDKLEEDDAEALVYLVDYRDGLRGAGYLSRRHVDEFAFGGRVEGKPDPLACWYDLPKPQRDHFSFLVGHAAQMILTGKEQYPVERTLLTGGMLSAILESKARGGKRIETPELNVSYRPGPA